MRRPLPLATLCVSVLLLAGSLFGGDLRITIPKRSKPTPVQKLNQDGVAAVKKHNYEKAKQLFYKAYLLDPDDPFTLNNLGYMAELDGNLDRAQRFYDLSAQERSDATVVHATSKSVEGKSVSDVAGKAEEDAMSINRYNVQALSLLQKDRAPEADVLLQKALALDAKNPFTLNNLGYTREKEGEYEQALNFYSRAANVNSDETIVVTLRPDWRGKPISEIAARNSEKLRKLMSQAETVEMRVGRLNLQGVSAMNRNDHATARQDFERAYKLAPNNAFTLNNMGYLAELDGDRETADFYYAKAAEAEGSGQRVALATRREAEGEKLGRVAQIGDDKVNNKIAADQEARVREGGPVQLRRRDNSVVVEPDHPPAPLPEKVQNPPPEDESPRTQIMQPLPDNQQPAPQPAQAEPGQTIEGGQPAIAAPQQPQAQPTTPLTQPIPQTQQPAPTEPAPAVQPEQPATPQQGQSDNGLLMPLPDDKQPVQTQPPQSSTPAQAQPAAQPPEVKQGPQDNGLIMPIPDQQPPSGIQPSGMPAAPAQTAPAQPNATPAQPQQAPATSIPHPQTGGQVDNGLIMPLPDDQQPAVTQQPSSTQPQSKKKDDKKKPTKPKKIVIHN